MLACRPFVRVLPAPLGFSLVDSMVTVSMNEKSQTAKMQALLEATGNAAQVLLDDLAHMRRIISVEQPDAGDLRRASAILRRILVEEDLIRIAAPRIGKILLDCPDFRPIHRHCEFNSYLFISADEVKTHGVTFSMLAVEASNNASQIQGYIPGQRVTLPVQAFLKQRVVFLKNRWITRAELIKYVANVAHGVHTGKAVSEVERLIRDLRGMVTVKMVSAPFPVGGMCPLISFNNDFQTTNDAPIQFRPDVIDFPLLNIISTAQTLLCSADVTRLSEAIARSG